MTTRERIDAIRDHLTELEQMLDQVLELADDMDEEDPMTGRGMGEFADELRGIVGDAP